MEGRWSYPWTIKHCSLRNSTALSRSSGVLFFQNLWSLLSASLLTIDIFFIEVFFCLNFARVGGFHILINFNARFRDLFGVRITHRIILQNIKQFKKLKKSLPIRQDLQDLLDSLSGSLSRLKWSNPIRLTAEKISSFRLRFPILALHLNSWRAKLIKKSISFLNPFR